MNTEEYELEPGEDAGLEPLGKYTPGRGMSSTMQDVFDVLYEAGEPLAPETIAQRTQERASGASLFHARRWAIRNRTRQGARRNRNVYRERRVVTIDIPAREAWELWIKQLLRNAALPRDGRLIRDDRGRYAPNPAKPGRVARVDGTTYAYTRDAWLETTREARTIGEIHTMTMEAERFLGHRSRSELLLVLEVLVDDLTGFGRGRRPLDPRTIRKQLRWLLERPTTDESRAWLLHELVRRIYEAN